MDRHAAHDTHDAPAPRVRRPGDRAPGPRPATALVVEPEPAVAAAEAAGLAAAGLAVAVVPDGGAALAALDRARPDLVVLDLELPGVSGFRLLEVLKRDPATAAVPVLVVTALDFAEAKAAAQTGADGFLTKPFDAAALTADAQRLVAGRGVPA
jgi:DNA-binding response OmpR family regulator